MSQSEVAIIVGAGRGLSASLARLLAGEGARVVLASRDVDKLAPLVAETGARAVACNAAEPGQIEALFTDVDAVEGAPSLVVYNPSRRVPGALIDVDPAEVASATEHELAEQQWLRATEDAQEGIRAVAERRGGVFHAR